MKHLINGVGLGLRSQHQKEIIETKPNVPWFEILIDNYFSEGGMHFHNLEKIREDYPIVFHSVGMSLVGTDPLDVEWFKRLKVLIDRYEPTWVSDHMCWTSKGEHHLHDLLPFPMNEESLEHVVFRIEKVQEILDEPILVENVSTYMAFETSTIPEWEFLSEVSRRSGCNLLLDVNNIYVNAHNHNFEYEKFIDYLPKDKVKQIHLAGYEDTGKHYLDSHSKAVWEPVWEVYQYAIKRFGLIPSMVEWDNDIPEFSLLLLEAEKAEKIAKEAL